MNFGDKKHRWNRYNQPVLDVNRLRVLVAFAEAGTLTEAAARLHYGQPTVTHHLQRLEAETGAVLVTRVGRRLRLTAEGRYLAARGAPILAALDRLERDLRGMTALESGVVRLAVFPSAVPTLVPQLLAQIARTAPHLRVDLVDAEPPDAARLLRDAVVDVALMFTYPDTEPQPDLHSESIGEDPLFLLDAGGDDAAPAQVDVGDLAKLREASWIAGCERCRGQLLSACGEAGFQPSVGFTSDDYVAVQALVAAGHGVTLLPGLALRAFRNPDVRLTQVNGQSRTITVATAGRPPHAPAVALVLQAARALSSTLEGH